MIRTDIEQAWAEDRHDPLLQDAIDKLPPLPPERERYMWKARGRFDLTLAILIVCVAAACIYIFGLPDYPALRYVR